MTLIISFHVQYLLVTTFYLVLVFLIISLLTAKVLGGSADLDGRILRGDQIMSVNGTDLSKAKQDEAVAVLKVSQGNVKIVVRRHKEEKKL